MAWALLNNAQNSALTELTEGSNSDRIVAIVGGAILDDSLRQALELRFRFAPKDYESVKKRTFKVSGALGNLGPKIDIGYLLSMFDEQTHSALYGIAEIRNFFAHNLIASMKSPNQQLTEAINKLTLHQGRSNYLNPFTGKESDIEIEETEEPRDVFIVNLKLCLIELMADHSKHQHGSNIPADY